MVFARRLLRDIGNDTPEKRHKLKLKKGATSINDLRVIDMYEEAIRHDDPLSERNGNWVQAFDADEDALRFAAAQFSRFQEVEERRNRRRSRIKSLKNRLLNRMNYWLPKENDWLTKRRSLLQGRLR